MWACQARGKNWVDTGSGAVMGFAGWEGGVIFTVFVEREDELTNRGNKVRPGWGREGQQRQENKGRFMDIYMKE